MKTPVQELIYRKQIALRGDEHEISQRLIGLLDWMESVPEISVILDVLRKADGARLLDQAQIKREQRSSWTLDPIEPPNARTLDEIASVGLALLEEAREQNRTIDDLAMDFGISSGMRSTDNAVHKYVIPSLDFVEQRLPAPAGPKSSRIATDLPPAIVHESLKRFRGEHPKAFSTCFVMMRFGKTTAHKRLEKTIKSALKRHELIGLLARDREFHDDLYPNIQTYMHGCAFGIAVFERLETEEFNPNIALEVGYMFGLRKQVLLLKDQTLRALHTDLVGKLYREFDPQDPETTIPPQIDSWLTDKGLA
jgi:hypothetical protein